LSPYGEREAKYTRTHIREYTHKKQKQQKNAWKKDKRGRGRKDEGKNQKITKKRKRKGEKDKINESTWSVLATGRDQRQAF